MGNALLGKSGSKLPKPDAFAFIARLRFRKGWIVAHPSMGLAPGPLACLNRRGRNRRKERSDLYIYMSSHGFLCSICSIIRRGIYILCSHYEFQAKFQYYEIVSGSCHPWRQFPNIWISPAGFRKPKWKHSQKNHGRHQGHRRQILGICLWWLPFLETIS